MDCLTFLPKTDHFPPGGANDEVNRHIRDRYNETETPESSLGYEPGSKINTGRTIAIMGKAAVQTGHERQRKCRKVWRRAGRYGYS